MSSAGFSFPESQDGQRLLRSQIRLLTIAVMLGIAATLVPLDTLHLPLAQYVPLHTVLEFCSVLVAFLVFGTVWFTPSKQSSAAQVMISAALLAAAVLNFMHMMSITGMPNFITANGGQKSIEFGLASRAAVGVAVLIGSFIPKSTPTAQTRFIIGTSFVAYTVGFTALVLIEPDILPTLFVEGAGTTPVKLAFELVLFGIFALAAFRYYQFARTGTESYYALMFGALALTAVEELFFAHYKVGSDMQNLVGHVYKIFSYWLIFKAMFILSIRKPYELLANQTEKLIAINESFRVQSLALESTETPVIMTDSTGLVTWQNRASLALKRPAHAHGTSIFDPAFTPDHTTALRMKEKLAQGEAWRGQVCITQSSGETVYLDRIVTPVRSENGPVVGYISVSENITQSVLSKARHKRVLETALDGYWVMGSDYKIIEVNAALSKMTGYTADELLTMRVHDLKPAEDLHRVEDHTYKIKRAGYDRFHTNYVNKEGNLLPVDVAITYDEQSDQFYVFVRDCTEQERSTETRQDLERQLQHSQKMQALGQLTGGIAHDFNNILASIMGYSNLALSRFAQDKESKLNKYLREIVAASERARDLIAKMLTFSRDQPSANGGIVDPSAVVDEVIDMLRPSIPSSIHLVTELEAGHLIRIDRGELNQVLVNLIINARDAITSHGGIELRIREVQLDGQLCTITNQRMTGKFVSIEVSDNGTGIAPAHMSRLFDPFFTTKDVGKGTGLGLAMVRGIMLKNGGHIVVTSLASTGSQFQLLFSPAKSAPELTAPVSISPTEQQGKGQTVWIVDDEKSVAEFLGELLMDSGYHVRIFNDPVIALSAFKANQTNVRLLITDQTMPGFTGIQLVGQMQQIRHDLPVIICTGNSEGIDNAVLERHVIEKVFIKPVPSPLLLQAVAEILAKSANPARHQLSQR